MTLCPVGLHHRDKSGSQHDCDTWRTVTVPGVQSSASDGVEIGARGRESVEQLPGQSSDTL